MMLPTPPASDNDATICPAAPLRSSVAPAASCTGVVAGKMFS